MKRKIARPTICAACAEKRLVNKRRPEPGDMCNFCLRVYRPSRYGRPRWENPKALEAMKRAIDDHAL